MTTEALDDMYARQDEEERACEQAQVRYEAARTPIGRFIARLSMANHRAQLADATEDVETGEFKAVQQRP